MVSSIDDMQQWFQIFSNSNQLPKSVRNRVSAKTSTRRILGHWQIINIKDTQTLQAGGTTIYGYLAKTLYLPDSDMTISLHCKFLIGKFLIYCIEYRRSFFTMYIYKLFLPPL